jgi:hypothetical protein
VGFEFDEFCDCVFFFKNFISPPRHHSDTGAPLAGAGDIPAAGVFGGHGGAVSAVSAGAGGVWTGSWDGQIRGFAGATLSETSCVRNSFFFFFRTTSSPSLLFHIIIPINKMQKQKKLNTQRTRNP